MEEEEIEPECTGMKRTTLIEELTKILRDYPDDGQILKEMIQNAEDADAVRIAILYDERQLPSNPYAQRYTYSSPYSKYFQGPALIVYNNEEFSEDDWEGILRIGTSIKELDPSTVGRFGLGFKSVFHITDYPMIISGHQMMILNPYLDEDKCCIPLRLSKLRLYRGFCLQECFEALGPAFHFVENVTKNGYFRGTMFRFPLRQTPTKLSDSVYNQEKINHLLWMFKEEASLTLIFLNSIEEICLYERLGSLFEQNPDYIVTIGGCSNDNARKDRRVNKPKCIPDNSFTTMYLLKLETSHKKQPIKQTVWLVLNRLIGISEGSKTLLRLSKKLAYLPCVGLAVPWSPNMNTGHIFCFMPLPVPNVSMTNLPVHVNGTFALSQNRQNLKWADKFTVSFKEDSVQWNELLISEVLPKVYTDVILTIIKRWKDNKLIFRCIPDPEKVDYRFNECVSKLFINISDIPFLYTEISGGKWVRWQDAVFPIFTENTENIKETLIYTMRQYNCCLIETQGFQRLYDILCKAYDTPPQDASPQFISERLLKWNSVYRKFEREDKLNILTYLISNEDFDLLISLELLPLANGAFIMFRTSNYPKVFVCSTSVRQLCPGMEESFVHQLPSKMNEQIIRLAKSGKSQLAVPNKDDVLRLISQAIEKGPGKSQDLKRVRWNNLAPLNEEWLRLVWEFFVSKSIRLPNDLYILPHNDKKTGCNYLLRLNQPLIVAADNRNFLPVPVVRCLNEIGVIVLNRLPLYVNYCSEVYDIYVERPTVDGVLKLVSALSQKLVKNFNDNVQSSDREEFVEFVGSSYTLRDAKHILKRLKMFKCGKTGDFVCVEDVQLIAPEDWLPVPLPEKMIINRNFTGKHLAIHLGARQVNVTDVVETIVKRLVDKALTYNDTHKHLMMNYIMENMSLFQHKTVILCLVKQIKFVKSGNGYLKTPNELFDPTDPLLVQMFNDKGKFPQNQDAAYLNFLKTFGLKSSSHLNVRDIYDVAMCINKKSSSTQRQDDQVREQANCLLNVLMKHEYLLETYYNRKTLKEILVDLNFIPPLRKPKSYPKVLKWFGQDLLCKPYEMVVNRNDAESLVGSTMPLFPDLPIDFIQNLNPNCCAIPAVKVFEQLLLLNKSYSEKYKPELHQFAKHIYGFLEGATINKELIESMKNSSIVWTGNGFCQPQKIYLNSSNDNIHLEPYLYELPGEFVYMQDFFRRLGCKLCQSPELLVNVQEQIKQHHIQIRTEMDYRRDLRHNINILTFFKRSYSHCITDYNVLIPVESEVENQLSLKHIHECAYRSNHWSEDIKIIDEEEPFAVHPDVTFAASIGIKSMEEHYLSDTGVLEWEQEVSLVSRIKSLLKGYRDGLSVPKELIQNADDAGATKVCFLYDERENLDWRTNLLNDKMSECQGPALWVYNNAQFCETDFKNITKLEGVTKDLSKIGKFGVGFCSVYNLTDVPSFVSGDIMVFFDPQGSYLMKNKTKGMKIDMTSLKNQRMLHKWSDQFKPFKNIFGCDLSTDGGRMPHFDGTLFRLPLRTSQQSGSELSSLVYSHDEMRQMLEIFIKSAGNLLLFTQNVSEMEIFHLSDIDTRRKRLIFQASRNLKWHSPLTYNEDESDGKKRNKVPVLEYCSQKINNSSDKNANFGTYQYSAEVVMKFKETGKQFHGQDGNSTKTTWMVSWASGTNECIKQSMQDSGAHMLPIAATAAMIQDNNGKKIAVPLSNTPYGFYDSSHLFCVLPLPIETPFNFHISGSFAVTQDRTQLSIETSDDKQRFELNWNRAVMKDAVVKSLFSLLQGLKEINVKPGKDLHLLWPVNKYRVGDLDIYKETQDRFIAELLTSDQNVIYQSDLDHWTQLSVCRIIDPQLLNSDVGLIAYKHSLMYLKDKGKILIQMPDWLLHQFTMIGGDTINDSLFNTVMFYQEVFLPLVHQGKVSDENRNKLLLFAVDKNDDKINKILINHACFSTTRGILRKPSEIILKQSSLSKLFVPGDAYFLDFRVEQETEHRVQLFKKLGMLYKSLPDCLIVDRCSSVEKIAKKCVYCAMQRCKDIFEYFERYPPEMKNELVNALTKIKFLPVMMKPKNWPFQWKVVGNEEMNKSCGPKHKLKHVSPLMHLPQFFSMECSENLYFEDCKDLICCTNLVVYTKAIYTKNISQILQSLGLKGYKKTGVALEHVVRQTQILISQCDKQKVKCVRPVLETIFEWLNNECKTSIDGNEEEMKSLLAPLQNSTCLLINDTLWSPNQVSLNFAGNCLPYLVGINQKDIYLSRCKTLLSFLDVKDRYSTNDISNVLMTFQEQIDIKEPIDEHHIHQYCSLLNALCIALNEDKIEEGVYPPLQNGEILVPDDENYLHPVHSLCLNDDVEIERSKSMKFACKHISRAQANILGIKSKKRKKISEHYKEMPFGQTEDLTTRIQKLLEGYPADEGIFKELLQNADDAGATEIHFVTDFNNYSSAKVFDGNFKELQGPSLLVYNNSSFAENDLKCIQLLGIGSKRKDPTSTGKYGVGFNAVYHLTDVPSFITKGEKMDKGNRTLCIFDPLCKYANGANKQKPGSRYYDLDVLKDTVPDVFVPYHEEYLMGDEGTIFRFPLRKSPSEISDNAMDTDQLLSLLGKFKTEAGRSLFFLNHIRKVLFSRVENGQIVNEYSVTINMSQEDNRQKREFHGKRLNIAEKIKDRTQITTEEVFQIRTTMNLCICDENNENVEKEEESWFVLETIGFNKNVVPDEVHHAYSTGGLGLLPQGGVALPLSNIAQKQFSAYCILPLPIITGLPMHVNGHFALNHESRRNLWEDNKESLEVIWNRTLMTSVIAPSYIAGLEKRRDICDEFTKNVNSESYVRNQLKQYFKHFPSIKKAEDNNWKFLCLEIYRQIKEEIPLFPTISKVSMNVIEHTSIAVIKCKVDWICLRKKDSEFSAVFCLEEKQSLDHYSVVSLMKLLNLQVIDLSCSIFEEMSVYELDVKSVTPDIVVTFLQSHLNSNHDSCKLDGLGNHVGRTTLKTTLNVDNLLNFCKKSSSFIQQLPGLPLCVTNNSTMMAYSEMTPVYVTKHCNIMKGLEEKFINKKIQHLMKDIESPCLKKFTLLDFEILIKDVISHRTYRESNTSFPWNPAQEGIPNQNWLRDVWIFFADVLPTLKLAQHKNENDSIAHVLSKWYLLPIRRGQQYELERIGRSKYVIYRESFTVDKPMHDALQRIEMPELDTRIFWRENKITKKLQHFEGAFKVAKGLVVSCDNSLDVFECLVHNLRSHQKAISEDDCSAILEYLNDNLETFELEYPINEILEKLRSIPVFITVDGYNTNVGNYCKVLVLPTNIPFVGLEEWASSSGIVLLKKITRITHLHIKLKFVACKTCELYSKYIIPNFQNMPQLAHLEHLEYIRDNILLKGIDGEFKSSLKDLINELSKCPFLFKNNVLLRASYFCNQHNDLFSVMCNDDTFPPSPYNDKEWESFMEIIGMKMEASPEMVVMFAKEVAREGLQTLSLKTKYKSKVLAMHVFNRADIIEELNGTPLSEVKSIRFIEPFELDIDHRLSWIHKQYDTRKLVSFDECTLYDTNTMPLVWTSTYLMPDYVTCTMNEVYTSIGVQVSPAVEHVVENLQNIAVSVHEKCSNELEIITDNTASFFQDLFVMHYMYLQNNGLMDTSLLTLKTTQIVFVKEAKICLLCQQIVMQLEEKEVIKPYLMRLPVVYRSCMDLFISLGSTPKASSFHFAEVLKCLHNDSLGNDEKPTILGPNERKDILVPAVRNLFLNLQLEMSVGFNMTDLFLPNRDFILHSSQSLIVSDNNRMEERAKHFSTNMFFAGFEKLGLQEIPIYILKSFPDEIKPKFLSELLTETIFNALECSTGYKVQMLSRFIKTDEFIEGLLRLVFDERLKHSLQIEMHGGTWNFTEQEQGMIAKRIGEIKVKQVSDLETVLLLEGRQLEESTERKNACVESVMIDDTQSWILYCIDNEMEMHQWLTSIQFAFVKLLEQITVEKIQKNLVFVQILLHSISNPALIKDKLDMESIAHLNSKNVSADVYPDPGTYVPPTLHYLLDNSNSDFAINDYVALLLYEEEENSTGQFIDPVYIYAKVVNCINNSQNLSVNCDIAQFDKVYLLDVGETDEKQVPAYKIFKFQRRRSLALKSKDVVLTDNAVHSPNLQTVDESLKEVKEHFIKILKITDETKRRLLIRRLRAKWHPDQNFGNEERATQVFKFIESLIRDLKDGKIIDEEFNRQSRYKGEDIPRSPYFAPPPQNSPNSFSSHNRFAHGVNREKVPIPRIARKWLRQAKCDRQAAEALYPHASHIPAFNWTCYHCHQSAEKALKAMWYNLDANNVSNSHELASIACGLPEELNILAGAMVRVVGHHTRMRYPDQISGDDIPSTVYSQQDADQCFRIASDIISFVSQRVQ